MADERARGGVRNAEALRAARAGRPSADEAARQLLSGDAWHRYCDALRAAGDHLLAANTQASETTRAEGFLYLLGLVRGGLGQALELADPARPRFFRNPDSTSRWGAENADNQYLWARVDPQAVYRISGTRGTAFDFLLEVKEGYMQLGDERNFATQTAGEIEYEANGHFEITLSAEPREGNWLRLDPDARYIAIRQYLCDWQTEEPARFAIECLEHPDPAPPVTPARVAAWLDDAAEWTLASARFWSEWTEPLRTAWDPRKIAPARKFAGGADDIYYGNSFYRLGPDEAMVIETRLPEARYWQFQLCDLWFRSKDWSEQSTSINHQQAHVDSDGRFRCVIAHHDPGIANWLDTGGEPEGLLQYRWIWSQTNPEPVGRVVAFDRIREHLAPDTPAFSEAERRAALNTRRRHRAQREPSS